MFTYFKNIIYNRISNTVYDSHIWSCKPDWELQFTKFCIKYPVFVLWFWRSYLWRISFYSETEMKTAICNILLNKFAEKNWPTGYFSVNDHLTPTLTIAQFFILHEKYFVFSKWHKIAICSEATWLRFWFRVPNPPYKAQNPAKVIGK